MMNTKTQLAIASYGEVKVDRLAPGDWVIVGNSIARVQVVIRNLQRFQIHVQFFDQDPTFWTHLQPRVQVQDVDANQRYHLVGIRNWDGETGDDE